MLEIDRSKAGSYSASSMKSFEGMSGVRIRPTMYIKATDERGIFKMALELIQNVIDEFTVGRANHLLFEYDTITRRMTVTDNGCGLPLESVFNAITKLHSGGKFDNEAYEFHAGQNGVGLTVCNALSTSFDFMSHRGDLYTSYHFEKGEHIKSEDIIEKKYEGDPNIGVRVSLIPDDTIFNPAVLDKHKLISLFEFTSYLNKGLTIDLDWDGKKQRFYSEEGLKGLLTKELKSRGIRYSNDAFVYVNGKDTTPQGKKLQADIVFNIANDKSECLLSFVNNMRTEEDGTHVKSFRMGLSQALNQYIKANDMIPKNLSKLDTSSNIIRAYITGIVSIKHSDPQFDGQTKEELSSTDVEPFIRSLTYNTALAWLNGNGKESKRIVELLIREARANEASRKARENIIKGSTKTTLADDFDCSKFNPCSSKEYDKCELIIVEGDSAAGNVNDARNHEYQAVLRLRGKITNVTKESELASNPSIRLLVKQMGCGFGPDKDLSKLKFGKIIILTDADEDGAHIQALLLGFFYKYYPELIERGNIYIAQPPLKVIEFKESKDKVHHLFVLDDRYNNYYLKEFVKYKFDLVSDKTGKTLSDGLFDLYIKGLLKYGPVMINKAKQICMEPNILEYCIIYYDNLINGKYKEFANVGVDVRLTANTIKHKDFDFDIGVKHYFTRIDDVWLKDIYNPLAKILSNSVVLNSVHFKYKSNGKIFKGTQFQYYEMINGFFEDSNSIRRLKGLGEMSESLLFESALSMKSRRIIRISMEDGREAERKVNLFLGKSQNDLDARKDFFRKRMINK